MKLTLGFSPCPNDTFIFDALVHHKVDTEGLEFDFHMTDVEELNQMAFEGKFDFTKVSYHAFLHLTTSYILLDSGSALGFGAGPLFISKTKFETDEFPQLRVAIPGKYTTANLLFSMAFPQCANKKEMVFSKIEQAILEGKSDAGVIIHENRFTYKEKGLIKIADLGEFWESLTSGPIPLGGIVAKRQLAPATIAKFNRSLRRSIEYAFENPVLNDFISCNAQEMGEEVMLQHIQLYVNDFSLSLGEKGRTAISTLFRIAADTGIIRSIPNNIFFEL